jgi:hypothetical protein
MTDPEGELSREDVLLLLAACPERVTDIAAGLDEARLRYRHGPAFPTLKEVIAHLSTAGVAVDALLRRAHLDRIEETDVQGAIDPPVEAFDASTVTDELLGDYVRVRRRTIDLLRGWGEAEWSRRLRDPKLGELTLLQVGRKVAAHEVGHLTQLRNLISLVPEPMDLGEVIPNRTLMPPEAPAPAPPGPDVDGPQPAGS